MTDVFILGLFNVTPNFILNVVRQVCAFLDFLVYFLIEIFFRAIFNLSNFELVGLYEVFEQRIYVILGIFMLFKVTVSLITYLANPDKLTDKEQGMAKVVTRIITVLVMLIGLPTFFNLMTEFQNKLLPVVPRVIIGTANTLSSDDVGGVASNMSLTMLQGFAHWKDECNGSDVTSVWGNETTNSLSNLGDFVSHINDSCVTSSGKKIYAYDYLPIFSTIVGILMIYALFSLCITVAVRAFKLIILRMLAPIPVVSYIDPKSSKDGMFATWLKTFMTTWVELFILLGIIYFIIYIIDFLLSGSAWLGFFNGISNPIDGIILLAFLIIGLLFFAKTAPKFIFDALGIKTKGSFARMLGLGASALGTVGSTRAAYRASVQQDKDNQVQPNIAKNLGASIFSGLAGGAAAGQAIISSDKPSLNTGLDAIGKYNANNIGRIFSGSTIGGRARAYSEGIFKGETTADINEREIKAMEEFNTALESISSRIKGEMVKQDWTSGALMSEPDIHGNEIGAVNYKSFLAAMNAAKATNSETINFKNANNEWMEISMEDAEYNLGYLLKNNEDSYLRQASDSTNEHYDQVTGTLVEDAIKKSTEESFVFEGRDSVSKTKDTLTVKITNKKTENAKYVADRRATGNDKK